MDRGVATLIDVARQARTLELARRTRARPSKGSRPPSTCWTPADGRAPCVPIVVHAQVERDGEALLERVRAALERRRLESRELSFHGAAAGELLIHVGSAMNVLSGYEARRVRGPALFAEVLREAGLALTPEDVDVRVDDDTVAIYPARP